MRFLTLIAVLVSVLQGALSQVHAAAVAQIGYDELFANADLVVIASPSTYTTETGEKRNFPGIEMVDERGRKRPIPAVGVETKFRVEKVIKGDGTITQFVLHHYRDASPTRFYDSVQPAAVAFSPSRSQYFLLFLIKENDGRFAPYGGQANPGADNAISGLGG